MNRTCNHAGSHPAFARHQHFNAQRNFGPGFRRPKYNVPVNIDEVENHYTISVYATGFEKENIQLSITDDVLYIKGTRTIDEENKPNFTKQEFPVKSFERRIILNGQVDTAAITAKQENGVLKISLPKSAEAKQPAQEIKVD